MMIPRMRITNPALRILFATLLMASAVACGQKGPLYLPDADENDTEIRDQVRGR